MIASESLKSGTISAARDLLAGVGAEPQSHIWVEQGQAADIEFSGGVELARAALQPLAGECDICVQSGEARRKKLIISDMDSTMIMVECIDELADYAGIKAEISEITERAMQGELDFAQALRARVKLLSGLDAGVIDICLAERVRIMPGAETLVRTMAGWGAHSILVSGGFTLFAGPVASQIGFAEYKANILAFAGGLLTGELEGDIVDAAAKAAFLQSALANRDISAAETLAVGDGANDIPMIQAAGLGIAYHAKEKARDAADFAINHGDLTAILFAQGVGRQYWHAG